MLVICIDRHHYDGCRMLWDLLSVTASPSTVLIWLCPQLHLNHITYLTTIPTPCVLYFVAYTTDADEGEVDSVFPNDNEDEVNSMNSSKKFEPTRTIHSDSNECSKTNDPRQSYKGSTSGSGQEEHAAKKSEAINAPSDQQKVTPSPKDDQKHIHEKTDICSVICHVSGKHLLQDF